MGKIIDFISEKGGGRMAEIRYSIKDIEDKATKLLKETNMLNAIPVDPVLLANKLNIRIYAGEFRDPDISGVMRKKGNETEILIQSDHHPNRQRFTIAHEIGHYILHADKDELEKKDIIFRRSREFTIEEEEANRFAAALLMPKKAILKEIEECNALLQYKDILVDYLATKFRVSTQAMRIRLFNLGLLID